MLFSLKNWGAYTHMNEAYDLSSPKRNAKPVQIVRKQVDKRIESKIWWQYSIKSAKWLNVNVKCDLHAILKGQ